MSSFPKRLIDGYHMFVKTHLRQEQERYEELADTGQSPSTMIIGCCDSGVSPEVIFDASPGELFVVRNVANIVPPYEPDEQLHGISAAIEFGVLGLKVKQIVVLGHSDCGGVRAYSELSETGSPSDFIGPWMRLMTPAAKKVGWQRDLSMQEYLTRLEQANIVNSLENLLTFPQLRGLIDSGQLSLHGMYFDVGNGTLMVYDNRAGSFDVVQA